MLLAIDTATRVMSLALHDGNNLIGEQTFTAGNRHSVLLAPSIRRMMAACSVPVDELTALGVSIGPGSYTGLRIGVAFAKGLAASKKLPLVGVTTLDTLAAAHEGKARYDLIATVQAGRGRIIAARYKWRKSRWIQSDEPAITEWAALFDGIEGQAFLTGEVNEAGRAALEHAREGGAQIILTSAAKRMRRAGFLAEEAWRRLNEGKETFESARLLPIYLKSSSTNS